MTTGDKSKYTNKQKRQAGHIEDSYLDKGVDREKAEEIAWSTVNKQDGGGKKPGGSGRKPATRKPKHQSDTSHTPKQPGRKSKPAKADMSDHNAQKPADKNRQDIIDADIEVQPAG